MVAILVHEIKVHCKVIYQLCTLQSPGISVYSTYSFSILPEIVITWSTTRMAGLEGGTTRMAGLEGGTTRMAGLEGGTTRMAG